MRRFAFAMLFSTCATLAAVACGGSNDNGGLFDTSGSATTDSGGGSSSDAHGNVTNDAGNGNNGSDSGNGGNNGKDSGNGGNGNDAGNGTDSGQSTMTPCTVDNTINVGTSNDCGIGEACIAPNCMNGYCQKVVTGSTDYKPVCGCDKVNYWNAGIAGDNIAAIRGNGACTTAAQCSGLPGAGKCPVAGINASCAYQTTAIGGGTNCNVATTGACWVVPDTCPTTTTGVVTCGAGNTCASLCDSIKNQTAFLPMACTIK
jgi:hypothetical protein